MDETNKENTSLTLTSSTFNTQLQITFTYPDTHNQEVFEVSRSAERQEFCLCWLVYAQLWQIPPKDKKSEESNQGETRRLGRRGGRKRRRWERSQQIRVRRKRYRNNRTGRGEENKRSKFLIIFFRFSVLCHRHDNQKILLCTQTLRNL